MKMIQLQKKCQWVFILSWIYLYSSVFSPAYAGIFQTPSFLAPQQFSIGVEPEVLFTQGGSTGINLRSTYGLSEWSNLAAVLGTGSGNRQFRVGGLWICDIFPDTSEQPGLGVAIQGLIIQLPQKKWGTEFLVTPYLHKTFSSPGKGLPIEPFFAIPIGLSLSQGAYQELITLSFGALFQHNEHFKSVIELGVSVSHTSSYMSGGIIYYY